MLVPDKQLNMEKVLKYLEDKQVKYSLLRNPLGSGCVAYPMVTRDGMLKDTVGILVQVEIPSMYIRNGVPGPEGDRAIDTFLERMLEEVEE